MSRRSGTELATETELVSKHSGAHNELVATVWLLRRGYDVFRNVSQHGLVDIVAMKDGATTLIDVKKSIRRADGVLPLTRLSDEQVNLGVKCLLVFDDGECFIEENPIRRSSIARQKNCEVCGSTYSARMPAHKFCSNSCKQKGKKIREAAYLEQRSTNFGEHA